MAKKNNDVAAEATVKKEKKKRPALRLIIVLVELAVIIGCIIGAVKLVEKYNDPQLTVDNYFKALLAGDYETAYSYVEPMEETTFINKDSYINAMEYLEVAGNDDYRIYSVGDNEYTMSYGNSGYMTIRLRECEEKRFFVFKDYEVVLRDVFAEDVTITAPKDVTITLNGMVLDSSNCAMDESDYLRNYETSYTIDCMYQGEYLVALDGGDVYQPYSEIMEVAWDNCYKDMYQPYLAEGVVEELIGKSYDIVAETYQDAMNQADTTAALDEIKAAGTDIDEDYNFFTYLKDDLEVYDGFFDYVNVYDFSGEIGYYSYDYETGNMNVNVYLYYQEDYGYQTLDWWDDTYEASTDTGSGEANFTYSYIDGEWVLTNLYIYSGIYAW